MAETDPINYFKSEIKRLNYYNSQFLVDTDFNDEQLYHNQMRRFHNRALHTWGIVEGLQVERVPNESKVTVAPGTAIDRLGREIVLPERSQPIPLDKFAKGAQVYITIKYMDVKDPADQDTSNQQGNSERYRRLRERPEVGASANAPAPDAPEAAMVLAVVTLDNSKAVAEVSPSQRRYAGSRFGSSGDGKEFSVYADMAGTWHFYDGGKGADRLSVDDRGNLGIGTAPTTARLSILTNPGPYDGTLVDFVVESAYKLSLRSKAPARDTVSYHFDLVNNLGSRFDDFLVFDRGNVGIGKPPTQKLHVSGSIYSESGGFIFPDLTTQTTAASSARIPAENVAAGTFGANVGGGAYTFPAQLYWGNGAARTETKDDASKQASKSGFYETSRPANYYAGASDWQHLIEARHSNDANNYALQIAGSFFDQNLYVRKTNGNGTTRWSQFALINPDGKVGIGTANPLGPLSIGDASVANSDGFIVLGKRKADGGTRQFRLGFDDGFNFVMGDYGSDNRAGTWVSQFAMAWNAPPQSLHIDSGGNVGMGSAAATGIKLFVNTGGGVAYSLKCEHRGSNFIVRPLSDGSTTSIIENTGGGALLINPSGARVGINMSSPRSSLHVQGVFSQTNQANDDWAKRYLSDPTMPDNTVIIGGTWDRWLYLYWKNNRGELRRAMLEGFGW